MKYLKSVLLAAIALSGLFLATYGALEVKTWMSFPIYVLGMVAVMCGVVGLLLVLFTD